MKENSSHKKIKIQIVNDAQYDKSGKIMSMQINNDFLENFYINRDEKDE